jgi:hypothetical protein
MGDDIMDIDDAAYNAYFGKTSTNLNTTKIDKPDGVDPYTYNQPESIPTKDVTQASVNVYISEGNISDIDQLGELLLKILNVAWGEQWGTIAPEFAKGENSEQPKFPQITYGINNREVTEKTPIKPDLFEYLKEVVNGVPTGDSFNIYRQWFDNIVEFDFWGRTELESKTTMNRFEKLMGAFAGYLKQQGVSEIFFLKEIPAKLSVKYVEGTYMKCLMFYVRLERIQTIRYSVLQKLDVAINTKTSTVNTTLSTGQ